MGAAFAKQAGPSSSKTVTVSYFTFSAAPDHLNTSRHDRGSSRRPTRTSRSASRPRPTPTTSPSCRPDRRRHRARHLRARLRELRDLRRRAAPCSIWHGAKDRRATRRCLPEGVARRLQADGKQYGAARVVLRRRALLQQGPVRQGRRGAPSRPTWTWADEKAAAEKLTEQGEGRLGRLPADQLQRVLQGARSRPAARSFSADGKKAAFDSPAGRRGGEVAGRQDRHDVCRPRPRAAAPPTSTPTCSSPASSRCGTPASGCSPR